MAIYELNIERGDNTGLVQTNSVEIVNIVINHFIIVGATYRGRLLNKEQLSHINNGEIDKAIKSL